MKGEYFVSTPSDARETVAVIRGMESWLRDAGISAHATFALDLGEAYRSAQILAAAVDLLLREPDSRAAASALAQVQAWTCGDLLDHLDRMKHPLEVVLRQRHARQDDGA